MITGQLLIHIDQLWLEVPTTGGIHTHPLTVIEADLNSLFSARLLDIAASATKRSPHGSYQRAAR